MNNFIQGQMQPRAQFSSSYFNPVSGMSTPTNNILWVNGIEGAKAWQLGPNSMAILLDSEADGKMYIKVSDNIGMSSLRIFNYVEETSSANVTNNQDLDLSQYVKKDEFMNEQEEVYQHFKKKVKEFKLL
jgi:hypothetical protein